MNFRFVKYLLILGFIFLKSTIGFSNNETQSNHLSLFKTSSIADVQEQSTSEFVFQNFHHSGQGNTLFFEINEDNEEDDEVQDVLDHVSLVSSKESFIHFFPVVDTEYLKPQLQFQPLGLRSNTLLFIVFRFIRI
ncbi:MAG: hypothetical protein V4638_04940 [Bacteroidota bacterium]